LIFEVGGQYASILMDWFNGTPPNPELICGSIILENLAGNEVTRWNFLDFTPDGYEPGNDGRTRFTLKHNRLPDEHALWELGGQDPFGTEGSRNMETDLRVEVESIDTGPFYPVVVDDETNRTLTLTYDYNEGHCIFDWVASNVVGADFKRSLQVAHEDEYGNRLWAMNYHRVFPIKYEIIDGFGLDTKLKARVIISYDFSEIA